GPSGIRLRVANRETGIASERVTPKAQAGVTPKQALDAASDAEPGERLRRFESRCGPRGSCRCEPCERDAGRWSFCPDCLTVFDDYGKPVNPVAEFRIVY